jgi:hypothetical protein
LHVLGYVDLICRPENNVRFHVQSICIYLEIVIIQTRTSDHALSSASSTDDDEISVIVNVDLSLLQLELDANLNLTDRIVAGTEPANSVYHRGAIKLATSDIFSETN